MRKCRICGCSGAGTGETTRYSRLDVVNLFGPGLDDFKGIQFSRTAISVTTGGLFAFRPEKRDQCLSDERSVKLGGGRTLIRAAFLFTCMAMVIYNIGWQVYAILKWGLAGPLD
jgi:hypothetical protein